MNASTKLILFMNANELRAQGLRFKSTTCRAATNNKSRPPLLYTHTAFSLAVSTDDPFFPFYLDSHFSLRVWEFGVSVVFD